MRILFVFVFMSSVAFGQSKKKQIEALKIKVDSINYVLEAERKMSKQQIDKANQNLQDANKTSTKKITELNSSIITLESNVSTLKSKIKNKENIILKNNEKHQLQFNKLEDSIFRLNDELKKRKNDVTCEYTESYNGDGMDSESKSVSICTYKTISIVKKGTADYRGKYEYTYEVYVKDESYRKVRNSEIFNSKKNQLLNLINKRINTEYLRLYKIDQEDGGECFDNPIAPKFQMDELFISFGSNKINFSAPIGLSTRCDSMGDVTIAFTLDEINPYLNL